ncbi:MAG: hypothetical protein CMM50_00095 [Rhodospirillaceae bacterium]|nr:hypothetical protein [Rhodospirillaceae bacterium]|tara:strand:+ start:294 stop:1040 length:747 start_codon:yes stop_codon:yes gene_type:complete
MLGIARRPLVVAITAAAFAFSALPAQAFQMVTGTASVHNVDLTFWVNGVAVETFSGEQFGGLPFVLWLVPGENEVTVRGVATGDEPGAEADVTVADEGKILDYQWSAAEPDASVTFDVSDTPEWVWLSAPAKPDAEDEVADAVQAAHDALTSGDAEAFRAIMGGQITDAAALMGQEQVDAMADDIFTALSTNTKPLPELTIESYRGGQVYKVVGPSGRAALEAETDDGGVTNFGTFFAFIDGRWRIIR